jgi:hypothetical protein
MKDGNTNGEDTGLERGTRRAFDEVVARTDGATRSRLNQARSRAMAELDGSRRSIPAAWLPAGAATAAAVALLAWLLVRPPDGDTVLTPTLATDLDILLETDDLELIEELEFYAWLDEQPELSNRSREGNGVG